VASFLTADITSSDGADMAIKGKQKKTIIRFRISDIMWVLNWLTVY
jgi:hypothetical protein